MNIQSSARVEFKSYESLNEGTDTLERNMLDLRRRSLLDREEWIPGVLMFSIDTDPLLMGDYIIFRHKRENREKKMLIEQFVRAYLSGYFFPQIYGKFQFVDADVQLLVCLRHARSILGCTPFDKFLEKEELSRMEMINFSRLALDQEEPIAICIQDDIKFVQEPLIGQELEAPVELNLEDTVTTRVEAISNFSAKRQVDMTLCRESSDPSYILMNFKYDRKKHYKRKFIVFMCKAIMQLQRVGVMINEVPYYVSKNGGITHNERERSCFNVNQDYFKSFIHMVCEDNSLKETYEIEILARMKLCDRRSDLLNYDMRLFSPRFGKCEFRSNVRIIPCVFSEAPDCCLYWHIASYRLYYEYDNVTYCETDEHLGVLWPSGQYIRQACGEEKENMKVLMVSRVKMKILQLESIKAQSNSLKLNKK